MLLNGKFGMKVTKLLFLIMACALASCARKNTTDVKDDVEVLDFNVSQSKDKLSCGYKLSFVRLETNDSCLIDKVNQIEYKNDTLFILDSNKSNLLAFKKDGAFLSKIGETGNGPGEFIWPSSIYLDKATDKLYIIDAGQQKLIAYHADTFGYLAEWKLPFDTNCGVLSDDTEWIWSNRGYQDKAGDFYYLSTDTDFQVINHYLKKEFKSGYVVGPLVSLYKLGDKTYGYVPFSSLIYELSSEGAVPVYSVKYGDFEFPSLDYMNEISHNGTVSYSGKLSDSGFISYNMVAGLGKYLFACSMVKGVRYIGLYGLESGKSDFLRLEDFAEVLKCGQIDYIVSSIDADCLAFPLMPASLKDLEQEGYEFCEELKGILPEIVEDDNPVLGLLEIE